MAQIKTWVANTWVKLLQTTGQSTNKAMSQKAVSDSLDSLKSDLVAKSSMLSYEEIMASTPPLDLNIAIPKASAIKTITDNFNNTINEITGLPTYSSGDLGTSIDNEDFFKAWINKIYTSHRDKLGRPIVARVIPNSTGVVFGLAYSGHTIPTYAGFIYIAYSAGVFYFGYDNGVWHWRNLI